MLYKEKKGKVATIFRLRKAIVGDENDSTKAISMKHFITKEQLFSNDKIKEAALEYVIDLLNNREPKDKYKKDCEILNKIHDVRMNEVCDENEDLTIDMFDETLDKLKKTKKDNYAFVIN